MHLTRYTDNALRCLTVLALDPSQLLTVPTIARRMHMSEDHLAKVVQELVRLGYVDTVKGRSGGMRLAKSPETIRIGRLVREVEENFALVECFNPEQNQCPIAPACVLAKTLDRALRAFLGVLDEICLADLVRQPRRLEKLLLE
jgi:Rrf2 family transcriptional regulator, nitric oxide-sensitive transcriptional repressor